MTQLTDRVRQVERLKTEKARVNKGKKERVAFLDMEGNNLTSDIEYDHVEEIKVDVAELKPSPPYVCKLLAHENGKNPSKLEKNDKFPKKTNTFDVTKCDDIFDLLVIDGQVLVPPGARVPPLEQRKKRGFCKYHNFLPHSAFFSGILFRMRWTKENWSFPKESLQWKFTMARYKLETPVT